MGEVLFVSPLPLGRCKSTTRLFDTYDGPKAFRCGIDGMRTAEADGFSVVVCDSLPAYIEGKSRCKSVNLGHGLTGGKLYALDEGDHPWVDKEALAQIDYAVSTSADGVPIVARQLGITEERVLPLGMARTDAYFEDGAMLNRFLHNFKRVYLYCPTLRGEADRGHLPRIDWVKVDDLLEENEALFVKRHYLTPDELTRGYGFQHSRHIVELSPEESTEFWLRSCDVLVTDYSSTMFDAYMLGKPVVLLCDDMREYLAGRGMYYDYPDFYSDLWLGVEGWEDLLVDTLRNAAGKGLSERMQKCLSTVAGACDGHSTERICDLIRRLTENGDDQLT